ncbi:ATP-binding protein [Brevibacillus sp. SYSU BS000544]|uniref:sensor histidine kinase n=1 Tax=Brevibacillus sp. SYSU BS000544 TaxID=3416443 RepID=UPI003CE4FAE3
MQRLWMKLAMALMLVSGGGILLSTLLSVQEMDYHFGMYVTDMDEMYAEQLIKQLQAEYQQEQGWGPQADRLLKEVASVLGLKLSLLDKNYELIVTTEPEGKANQPKLPNTSTEEHAGAADHAGQAGHAGHSGNVDQQQSERIFPIHMNGQLAGILLIEHTDRLAANAMEEHFQMAHTSALVWTMILLTTFVCVVSILLARRLVKPVIEMSKSAKLAATGDYSVQVTELKSEDELAELVTSFNQLVIALKSQEELRKRLTSDISHELRTPLNTLLAQVEGMIDGIWESNAVNLESMRLEVLRLSGLVQDLDLVLKAEAGEQQLIIESVRVHHLLEEVVHSMSASFQRQNVSLDFECNRDWHMEGDRTRLSQILMNLLANALKHTPEGGAVKITVMQVWDRLQIEVRDSGVGISPDDIPFVFERFYRGDRSRQRGTGGSGLGLTIVKRLVEAHHGTIHISSKQGQGTTVTMEFPQLFHQG